MEGAFCHTVEQNAPNEAFCPITETLILYSYYISIQHNCYNRLYYDDF